MLTRSSEDGDKVLNTVPLPVPFPSGNFVTVVGTTSAWSAANVPYRCAIAFDGDGSDIDPSDDADEVTFPKQ
ncbi:MAG TPA: hypothetical protein VGL13_06315 [Polyangiaceae bacterium]